MSHFTTLRLRRLASPPISPQVRSRGHAAAILLLRLACVVLLAWIGYIHLHLWLAGYRHIPVNGPLFLLDAVAAFTLAALLLAWPRPVAGLAAAGFAASTLGALLLSLGVGLFGFRESISASDVVASIVVEAITAAALLAWSILDAAPWPAGGSLKLLARHMVTGQAGVRRAGALPAGQHR